MTTLYDTRQSVYAVKDPNGFTPIILGQNEARGEASFWYNLGYTIFRWAHNGKQFDLAETSGD